MKPHSVVLIILLLILAACSGNDAEELKHTFSARGVSFRLPEDWREDEFDRVGMQVFGGTGFASPDYAGLTYLRLHQGEGFVVIDAWDMEADAASVLESSFAVEISEPEPIDVLGQQGTYAHGKVDQGQGIGAVHVLYEQDDEQRQLIFIGVVADEWEQYEPTFLEIIKSAAFVED